MVALASGTPCGGGTRYGIGRNKVLPDDRSEPLAGRAKYDESAPCPPVVERARQFTAFMAESNEAELKRVQRELAIVKYRASNQAYILAMEQALNASLGLTFQDFKLRRAIGALPLGTKRYFLQPAQAATCPGHTAEDPPDRRRSCIVDSLSSQRWLEVPRSLGRDGLPMPSKALHVTIDRGSIGFPAFVWLFSVQKVHGTLWSDFSHDDWNGLKGAALGGNVWLTILERLVVLSLPSGPWEGASFYQEIRQTAKEFFRHGDHNNGIFVRLFSRICAERGDQSADLGSDAHRRRVWESVQGASIFTRKGSRLRVGRWFDVFKGCEERDGELQVLCMILLHIGLRDKYWPSIDQSPYGLHMHKVSSDDQVASAKVAEERPSAEALRHAEQKATVSRSNAALSALRKQAKNTMDLACRILCNSFSERLMRSCRQVVALVRESFGRWLTMSKTQIGMRLVFERRLAARGPQRGCRCRLPDVAFCGELGWLPNCEQVAILGIVARQVRAPLA